MFRIRDPQESLWQSQFLVTPKKAKRLERSWAEVFRNEALPLIDEERFAPMYCVDNGRPNRAVQTVLGVHLLKEMFNLTDALEQLEFNPGNVHSAEGWQELLEPVVKRYQRKGRRLLFRGDAAFGKPEVYEYLEQEMMLGNTPSGFQLTRYFREKLHTCWYDLPTGLPGGRSSPTTTSLTRPRAGVFPGE